MGYLDSIKKIILIKRCLWRETREALIASKSLMAGSHFLGGVAIVASTSTKSHSIMVLTVMA